jgi:cellulose synthase/poly-beta-1,6-N-acetylglucosamine synthase-like glycosyltransferase
LFSILGLTPDSPATQRRWNRTSFQLWTSKYLHMYYLCVNYKTYAFACDLKLLNTMFETLPYSATNNLVYLMFVLLLILCSMALGLFFTIRSTPEFCK